MVVDVAALFDEALQHNSPGYALGHRLAELFPEQYVLEEDGALQLHSFARHGHCTIELRPSFYNQLDSMWSATDETVHRWPKCAWQTVTWLGTTFDVIILSWPGNHDPQRTYIAGPDRARTEALFSAVSKWNHEVRGEILVFSDGCFEKSSELYTAVKAANFDQLVLDGTLVEQIRADFTTFLASREIYADAGVPWRRGALFIGPPGNGKTLCVKALINLMTIPCLYVQSFECRYATPQRNVDAVFERARKQAPCIMVLEDIDALLVEGTRSFFLNQLDGFASNAGIITLATTNHPERLDPSIIERPSRFDRKYHFDIPSGATRARYVALWNERLKPALRLDATACAQIAERTEGFTFAYIQEVFVSATMHWMNARSADGLLPIAIEQIELLRAQMTSTR